MRRLMGAWRLAALTSVLSWVVLSAQLGASTRTPVPPPPPPAEAPASLQATSGHARVTLTWAAVAGAKGYRIFRSTDGALGDTPIASVGSTSFRNYHLENGTTYRYRVAAFTRGGNGPLSIEVSAIPLAPPTAFTAARGDRQVTLSWAPSAGATSYTVYRKTAGQTEYTQLAAGVPGAPFVDSGLTNGQAYYYRLRAVAGAFSSGLTSSVWAKPQPPPPATPPGNLVATAANARVTLTWDAVAGATSYRVYRSTTGVFDGPAIATVSGTTFKNWSLTNGTTYFYRVAGRNPGGEGPASAPVSATPMAPPPAPTGVAATAGNGDVTLTWTLVPEATSYNVYRGTTSLGQAKTPVATGVTAPPFVDVVANGPTYYYRVAAVNVGGQGPRSAEVSASPEAPPAEADPATVAAFRSLRQATWGPRPGDVDAFFAQGLEGFLDAQLAAVPSEYPDTLFSMPVEAAQEHFMQLALNGPDQLRQRVAWALHKIWVVSAVEVTNAPAIVTYYRLLMGGALGNYRDLMRAVTLNPAMGRYLNMLNNRSQQVTGVPPNENYPRELMQLFTIGIPALTAGGTPMLDEGGQPVPAYTEHDVKELARILTGWTFGDGDPATAPRRLGRENWRVPMEAVEAYHDNGPKVFLGEEFAAGQAAAQDLEQALDVLFNHPNMGPFVSRQLIQQLVTSNPSPGYVADVAAVFAGSGGVRGDLAAVVRAILTHPEAAVSTSTSGKLSEPVLFVASQLRALNATVTDHPFMSDKAEEMGQKVFYPPSVFSYFSPGFRVRGALNDAGVPLTGPEFQILTAVTALVRVNFVGAVLGGHFGSDVQVDLSAFTSRADDPPVLVDYVSLLLMGGRMSPDQRAEVIAAVRATPATKPTERARTALYLTLAAAQAQVDR